MAQSKAQQVKETIKHFLHPEKTANQETTADASPGYVQADSLLGNTTTHLPEAFFPGARPVVPREQHIASPYSSALGQIPKLMNDGAFDVPPQQPSTSPSDKAQLLGAPPSGSTAAPSSNDTGPEQTTGEGENLATLPPKAPPTADPETKELSTIDSDAFTKDNPIAAAQEPAEESKEFPTTDAENSLTDKKPEAKSELDTDDVFEDSKEHLPNFSTEKKPQEKTVPAAKDKSADPPQE